MPRGSFSVSVVRVVVETSRCATFVVVPDEFFPPPPEGATQIHDRRYQVRTYKLTDDVMLLRGVVCDEKPAGLYIDDDPDPLWMHHMIVDLHVAWPTFEIVDARVEFREHPHTGCTNIVPEYQKLIGLSITRGFNAKVKELFGGPRGCTHIGALLQAMGPVAIQSGWSMRVGSTPEDTSHLSAGEIDERRRRGYAMNLNTCHIWDENGEMVSDIRAGRTIEVPLSVSKRLTKLGRDEAEWEKMRG